MDRRRWPATPVRQRRPPLTNANPAPLADLQLRYRLPGMFSNKENVRAGGLMSYGADFNAMYRRAATYIDEILRGLNPPTCRLSKRLNTSW